MNGPSMTAPALQDLLKGGTLTGEWVLDPRNSSVRLKSKSMGLIPVKGIFREISGSGSVHRGDQAPGDWHITGCGKADRDRGLGDERGDPIRSVLI